MEIPSSQYLSDQIAESYYDTTARRAHTTSVSHYENGARGLKLMLQKWLPQNKDARCLDLASGCGEFLYLLESLGFSNTAGVDLCQEELDQARGYVKATLTK